LKAVSKILRYEFEHAPTLDAFDGASNLEPKLQSVARPRCWD
jgi:hypothetical protein